MRKKKRNIPFGSIIILIMLLGSYLFFNFQFQFNDRSYIIDKIDISGNYLISQEEILTIITDIKLDTLNDSKIKMIHNTLKSNSFIKEVWVKVSHPSTLIIRLSEFEPEAILLGKKKHYLAADGNIYPYRFLDDYKEIPIVSGIKVNQKDELQKSLAMLKIIRNKPALLHLVSEICWNGEQLDIILTQSGIKVEIPGNNWHEKIFLLDRFLQRNYSKIKEKKYRKINLHYKDKIICS